MRDGTNTMLLKLGIPPGIYADDTPLVTPILDTQGWESVEAFIATGTLADSNATFVVSIEDGNDPALADAAAVVDQYLVSQSDGFPPEVAAGFTAGDNDNEVRKIEVLSRKRFVRKTITPSGNTGNAFIGSIWRLTSPGQALVAQTPS